MNFLGDRISKASEDADRVDVLHVDDNGNVSDPLKTVSVEGEKAVDSVEINAEHFSTYTLCFYKTGTEQKKVVFNTYSIENNKDISGKAVTKDLTTDISSADAIGTADDVKPSGAIYKYTTLSDKKTKVNYSTFPPV